MTFDWLVGVSWVVFLIIGFTARIRGRWAQEPFVLIGLIVGGAIFFAIDYSTFDCELNLSLMLCSAEASVVWGIAAGCLFAILFRLIRPSKD